MEGKVGFREKTWWEGSELNQNRKSVVVLVVVARLLGRQVPGNALLPFWGPVASLGRTSPQGALKAENHLIE